MASVAPIRIWCDEDDHRRYEDFADFNEWFDGDEGTELRALATLDGVAKPSKAFFAGDREAYDITLASYRANRRNEQLGKAFLDRLTGDGHWSIRNERRFDQLCDRMIQGEVVPFVGAGVSKRGGFPTWADHLRAQGRTAGMEHQHIEDMIAAGDFEGVIAEVEVARGRDVFIQEIRDEFGRNGTIPEADYLLAELFRDTIITTNYDRLIEQAFDTGDESGVEIVTPTTILAPPVPGKTTIIKLHGDIRTPAGCILSKNQYDAAYGAAAVDVRLPIPQVLDYYYRNGSLLFLGCSLYQDRTIRVFEAIKATTDPADLPQHFSLEQCPSGGNDEIAVRNAYLLRLGITPIWFEGGRFEFVEGIIRLARNELRYQTDRRQGSADSSRPI